MVVISSSAFVLTSCMNQEENYAPVVDASTIEHIPQSGVYHVLPGDTLYSVAWRYGLDYRYVALRNHIAPPYHIEVGETIYLRGAAPNMNVVAPNPVAQKEAPIFVEPNVTVKQWNRPARGKIMGTFSSWNKGINIAGAAGNPIYATAAGQVVYCGDGLRGYGNLIIIKHNHHFLSAYAHNRHVLVKQGEWVKAKQQIAEMGHSGSTRVMLHFEIRRDGRPVNPLNYIN